MRSAPGERPGVELVKFGEPLARERRAKQAMKLLPGVCRDLTAGA